MALHWQVADGYRDVLESAGLGSARALLKPPSGDVVAQSRTTSTVRLPLDASRDLFLKQYRFPERSDRMRGLLRGTLVGPSKARREWENLGILPALGVGVPDRIAYGEERRLGFLHACFIATMAVPHAERCDWILGEGEDGALVEGLGRLAGTMHRQGYRDGSLALRNVLARSLAGGGWQLFKIDCPKGSVYSRLSLERSAADLAVLTAGLLALKGPRCLDRFFSSYGEARGSGFLDGAALRSMAEAQAESRLAREKGRLAETGSPRTK